MTRCRFTSMVVPGLGGMGTAYTYCEEHGGMPVTIPSFTSGEVLCPIGRIEKATEEALAKLADAVAIYSNPMSSLK